MSNCSQHKKEEYPLECDYCGEVIESLLDLKRDKTNEFHYHAECYLKLVQLGQISNIFMEQK